jgi:hypothetical protein
MAGRGRPKGSKNKPKIHVIQRAAAAPAPRQVAELRDISPSALKRAMIESAALLEENKERQQTANQIKRDAIQKGIDPKAYALLLALWRDRSNGHKLGAFLRGFDRGRDALNLDALVPPDMFESEVHGHKSHLQDGNGDEAVEMTREQVEHIVETYDDHHAA